MADKQSLLGNQYAEGVPVAVPVDANGKEIYGQAPQQAAQPYKVEAAAAPASEGGYQDVWATVLFGGTVGLMGYFAFAKGVSNLTSDESDNDDDISSSDLELALGLAAGSAVVGALLALGFVSYAMKNARSLIKCTLWTNVVVNAVVGCLCLLIGAFPGFIIFMILALISWCYMMLVRRRIPFAAANLACACAALLQHKSILNVAYVGIVLQFAWVLLWAVAAVGVYGVADFSDDDTSSGNGARRLGPYDDDWYNDDSSSSDDLGEGLEWFGMLVAFYWGLQVFANVVHVTVAGVTSSWWFQGKGTDVVSSSLKRSLTTSFGSICFGSLVVAILQAMRAMAESGARQRNAGALCARCILSCLERIMRWINMYAFVFVGTYGMSFMQAGKATFDLLSNRGWTAILNDDLVGGVLTLGAFMVGAITSAFGMFCVWAAGHDDLLLEVGIVGFLVGFAMAIVTMKVLHSAVVTVFVCFAQDPAALSVTHPEEYNELLAAWQEFHPTYVTWIVVA